MKRKTISLIIRCIVILVTGYCLYALLHRKKDAHTESKAMHDAAGFEKIKGIYFQHPKKMVCKADEEAAKHNLYQWVIIGKHSVIEVSLLKFGFFDLCIKEIKQNLKRGKYKVREKSVVLAWHNKRIKGTLLKVKRPKGYEVKEVYGFRKKNETLVLVILTDYRQDAKMPTKEFVAMKTLLEKTLKLKKGLAPLG